MNKSLLNWIWQQTLIRIYGLQQGPADYLLWAIASLLPVFITWAKNGSLHFWMVKINQNKRTISWESYEIQMSEFTNNVFGEHRHPHPFLYCLWLSATTAEFLTCDRDYMAYKAKNFCCLPLYRKSSLNPIIPVTIEGSLHDQDRIQTMLSKKVQSRRGIECIQLS